jgi:hypothetical protein
MAVYTPATTAVSIDANATKSLCESEPDSQLHAKSISATPFPDGFTTGSAPGAPTTSASTAIGTTSRYGGIGIVDLTGMPQNQSTSRVWCD